jgi:hypothetical protein
MASPQILFEGGPIDRRTKRIAAGLAGFAAGITLSVIILFTVALHASYVAHEAIENVKAARVESIRRTCEEGDLRHTRAIRGLERLIARHPTNLPRAEHAAQRNALYELGEVISPYLDCKARVAEQTKP